MALKDLTCSIDLRREKIRETEGVNGLDFLLVSAAESANEAEKCTVKVYFVKEVPKNWETVQFEIIPIEKPLEGERASIKVPSAGGERPIRLVTPEMADGDPEWDYSPGQYDEIDSYLAFDLSQSDTQGQTSFMLRVSQIDRPILQEGNSDKGGNEPFEPIVFDPLFDELPLSTVLKAVGISDLDCADTDADDCSAEHASGHGLVPEINYLARDYAGFRKLILDRLSLTIPDWQERHVPDIGITLVEIMAYVGDHLSYFQDAVATEAYLDTARQRISIRRHARLVDYHMHEGCSARAWLHLETSQDFVLPSAEIAFVTGADLLPSPLDKLHTWDSLAGISPDRYEVFNPLGTAETIKLVEFQNRIQLYTWGSEDCCLPKGSISATLVDAFEPELNPTTDENGQRPRWLKLQVGDVIIFEEIVGPNSGLAADADISHRHAVRILAIKPDIDALYQQPILKISWDIEDALPFDLCISAIGPAPYCERITDVSVARGNVILVDHGHRIDCENLGDVPIEESTLTCVAEGRPSEITTTSGRFSPILSNSNLTYSQPIPEPKDGKLPSARKMLEQDVRKAIPAVELFSKIGLTCDDVERNGKDISRWYPVCDLLDSDYDDKHFMVEVDNDGTPHLRFGDGQIGQQPLAGETFVTKYRVGKGEIGNIGAEAIRHLILEPGQTVDGVVITARNLLAASGGVDPEPTADVKLFAPHAFRRRIERAIIEEDYNEIVVRDFANTVQAAHTNISPIKDSKQANVTIVIDPLGQIEMPAGLPAEIEKHLEQYRRIGHVVQVQSAEYVGLSLTFRVHIRPNFIAGHVKAALLDELSNRRLNHGRLGFFHPDRSSFGDGIALSKLVAAIQQTEGVVHIEVTSFEKKGTGSTDANLKSGLLPLEPMEIVSFENTSINLIVESPKMAGEENE